MRTNKKLLVVFVMVFALAMAGGGIFATNANAQCGICGLNLSWLNPCNWHFPSCFSCDRAMAPPANMQAYNGEAQQFPND
ncbi:MAG: hypothetical protein P4L55_02540 [Syntrophobacteraceae bacterium]|nr:hypothetical protein [Syntrophobacteraceae bacterium]